VTQNSMDAVSDRDFAVEFCSSAALLGRASLAAGGGPGLWSSSEFNFIRIADAYTTGSSLMPQKKNPDVAELMRGKSGRVIGNLVALLTLLKGLPMTYNRDLQEDKERLFDTADTVRATVRLARRCFSTPGQPGSLPAAAGDPALLATDLADYSSAKACRSGRRITRWAPLVALAERLGKPLNQLTSPNCKSCLWPRRAGRVQSATRNGQAESGWRAGNEGSGEATEAMAGTAVVKNL
jgi:argininosuccinate lyase